MIGVYIGVYIPMCVCVCGGVVVDTSAGDIIVKKLDGQRNIRK